MSIIGVITTSYPRWRGEAAGNFVAGHVAYLRRCGAIVEVIAADDAAVDRRYDRAHSVTRVGVAPGLFYGGGAPEVIMRGGVRVAAQFAVRLAATVATRAHRWDAVAAHWLTPSALAALATRGPLLAIAHGGDVHLLASRRWLRPVLTALAVRGARIACVSADLHTQLVAARPPTAAIVTPMGVDGSAAAAIASVRAGRVAGPVVRIGILARLVPIKGIDVALAALTQLPPHVELVIAGDGPQRAALADRARQLAIAHRVRFVGWLDAGARDQLLGEVDVIVVPSRIAGGRREGTPMAALEALAAGVPVVVSACGGLADLAIHGAHVVAPEQPVALARAILHAISTPAPPVAGLAWDSVGARLDAHWGR